MSLGHLNSRLFVCACVAALSLVFTGRIDADNPRATNVFIADTGDDHAPFPGYQNTLILSAPGGKLVGATANLPQVYDYTHSAAAAGF